MSFNKQGGDIQRGSAATQGGNPFNTGSDFGDQNARGNKQTGAGIGAGTGATQNYSHNILDQDSYDQDTSDYGKANTGFGTGGNTRGTQTGGQGNYSTDYRTSGQAVGTGNANEFGGGTGTTDYGNDNLSSGYGSGGRSAGQGAGTGFGADDEGPRGRGEGNVGGGQQKTSATDKLVGGAQKMAGKVTSNTGMYERGQEKAGDNQNDQY